MKVVLIALLCLMSSICLASAEDSASTSDTVDYKRFEFSFGQSILFISNSKVEFE